jgi:LCP family protein required for cell wall assembly
MKLSGNSRKGRHVGKNSEINTGINSENNSGFDSGLASEFKAPVKRKKRRALKIAIASVLVLIVAAVGIMAVLKLGAAPPEVKSTLRPRPPGAVQPGQQPVDPDDPDATPLPEVSVEPVGRNGGMYTFLVLGMDDGNGNTDTMMVATLNTETHKLNVVSIPRDTLVNVSWPTKKANSLFANVGIDGTITKLADILGYEVDFYVIVDLKAFSALVDAVDGVDFDVPVSMNYDDPSQNLSIHISKGMHHMNGKDAIGVVRFRSGYASADIGRIATQQKFLMSAASQILAKKNSISIKSIVEIFLKYVKTDLTSFNLVWLADELFKLDAENIVFDMIPGNTGDSVGGQSYVTIYVNEWLEMLNSKLNPFDHEITADELSIYTRGSNRQLYVTDGVYAGKQSWGSGSTGTSSGSSSATKPSATPDPAPTPSTSPSPPPDFDPSATPDPNDPTTTPDGVTPTPPSDDPNNPAPPDAAPTIPPDGGDPNAPVPTPTPEPTPTPTDPGNGWGSPDFGDPPPAGESASSDAGPGATDPNYE